MATQKEIPKRALEGKAMLGYLVEVAVYSVFVFFYFFLVLHFLRDWIKDLFDSHKSLYAIVALGLMAGQAVVLELVTTAIFRFIPGKSKKDK